MPRKVHMVPSIAIVIIVLISAWGNAYQSCQRSDHVREALQITFRGAAERSRERAIVDHGLARKLDLETQRSEISASERLGKLVCLAPLPPT